MQAQLADEWNEVPFPLTPEQVRAVPRTYVAMCELRQALTKFLRDAHHPTNRVGNMLDGEVRDEALGWAEAGVIRWRPVRTINPFAA